MSEGKPGKLKQCCVGNCDSIARSRTHDKQSGQILFKFPTASKPWTDEETRLKWLDFVRIKRLHFKPNDESYVCSDHFTFDCMTLDSVLKMQFGMKTKPVLKKTAYPTIHKETDDTESTQIETNITTDTDESPSSSTKTRSKMKLVQEKSFSKSSSPKSNSQRMEAEAEAEAKSNSAKCLGSKNKTKSSKMTTLKSKYTTSQTPVSKTQTSTREENSTKPGKRSRKTPRKKRKISGKPEIVIERWGEDEKEEDPEDEEAGPRDEGRVPGDKVDNQTDKEKGSPDEGSLTDKTSSKSVNTKRTEAQNVSRKTEQVMAKDALKEFFKIQIDPKETENFIKMQNALNSKANCPDETKSNERNTFNFVVLPSPGIPFQSFSKPACKTKGPNKEKNETEGSKKPFGISSDPTNVVSKEEHPKKAYNKQNMDDDKEMTLAKENDVHQNDDVVLERHIKLETEVSGSFDVDADSRLLDKDPNAHGRSGSMLGELAKSGFKMESVDMQDKNIGLHQELSLLDKHGYTSVDLCEKRCGFDSGCVNIQNITHNQGSHMVDTASSSLHDLVDKGFDSGYVEFKKMDNHQGSLVMNAAGETPSDFVEKEHGFSSGHMELKNKESHQKSLMMDAAGETAFVEKERGCSSPLVELKNMSKNQESPMLDAAGCFPVGKGGLNSIDHQGHLKGPTSSTGFDGVESILHDQAFRVLKDSSENKDNSGFDSDIALPMDEDENMIFCCSTCGDVQSVDGEPRLVICNDKTMKMTNSLSSEVMSVFCKKCSTDTETCFQCNGHIMRGNFKEHLKLHFG